MRRVLVVGEDFGNAPAEYHDDVHALTGASGRRLAALCGYEGEGTRPLVQFARDFERTNVVTAPSDWHDYDLVWRGVLSAIQKGAGRRAILLGSRVARAFRQDDLELFEARRLTATHVGDIEVVRAPHPSGRNRWWNDPENVARAESFWREQRALAES